MLDPNQNLNDGSFPFTSSVTNALVADPNVHVGTNGNISADPTNATWRILQALGGANDGDTINYSGFGF